MNISYWIIVIIGGIILGLILRYFRKKSKIVDDVFVDKTAFPEKVEEPKGVDDAENLEVQDE